MAQTSDRSGIRAARPRAVDWILTIPFLVAFGAILLVFDPLQRVARLFGQRPQEIVAGALQVALVWAFRLSGARIQVERSPLVRPNASYVFIANHQSMFDIPILGSVLFTNFPKYVSKRELAHWIPSISYNLRRGGNALIDRGDREQATREIRRLGEQIQERGVSAVIYPEGTRARTGELGHFKPAGALTLLEAAPDTAVVPVVIDGSWKLLRFNLLPVPFGTRIRIRIDPPIPRRDGEDRRAMLQEVREQIQKTLAIWRDASLDSSS
jgi:1-acyl-sn-glycerol-3-phosphate acyltransferase